MANEYKLLFKESLKMKRRQMGPGNRARTKSPNSPMWLYPHSSETKYFKMINDILIKPLFEIVNTTVKFKLPDWIADKKHGDSNRDSKQVKEAINNVVTLYAEMNDKLLFIHKDIMKNTIIDEIKKTYEKRTNKYWEPVFKNDTWFNELQQMILELQRFVSNVFGVPGEEPEQSDIWPLLLGIAGSVLIFNGKQWDKITKQVLGFPFATSEDWWPDVREAWANENINLLKNWSEDFASRVQETIFRGVRNGLSSQEIMQELRRVEKISKNRAKLIVRDQIGKLNGVITKKRMTEAGIDTYKWLTAQDERVRGRPGGRYPKAIPSHWEMEGKICTWSDDFVYTNESDIIVNKDGSVNYNWKQRTGKMPKAIPGEEIQCRCTGTAYFDPVIAEVDNEIVEENAA